MCKQKTTNLLVLQVFLKNNFDFYLQLYFNTIGFSRNLLQVIYLFAI